MTQILKLALNFIITFLLMFKKSAFILFILIAKAGLAPQVKAQCSKCIISAEQGKKMILKKGFTKYFIK